MAVAKLGLAAGSKPFDLVFHGGSGSLLEEIDEALSYGVVKMNVDTDTQYAFTRPIAAHMFTNYDGVLKIDGEVGNKKVYDPRSYMKKAEARHGRARHRGLRGSQEHRDEPRRLTSPGAGQDGVVSEPATELKTQRPAQRSTERSEGAR